MADSMPVYKMALMGNPGVGKSTLAQKFLNASETPTPARNTAVIYQKKAQVEGKEVQISVMDTPGIEDSARFTKNIIERATGFIIVFSVTDEASFKAVNEYRGQVLKVKKDDKIPIILVGNKSDAEDWTLTPYEISEQAREWNVMYIETSTVTPKNVEKPFLEMAKMISVYKPLPDQGRRRPCCEIL